MKLDSDFPDFISGMFIPTFHTFGEDRLDRLRFISAFRKVVGITVR